MSLLRTATSGAFAHTRAALLPRLAARAFAAAAAASAAPELVSSHKCWGGEQQQWRHASSATRTDMEFSVFVPPGGGGGAAAPNTLYWLSGLTCTDRNFVDKSGFQRLASALNLVVVCPDTSPRGAAVPGEDDAYDFGTGAGFYVDATEAPYADNYRMHTYVADELPALVEATFDVSGKKAVSGHSMGGHGALVLGLRRPGAYASVSALSPICAPTRGAWGRNALGGYLGHDDEASWEAYDACALLASGGPLVPAPGGNGTLLVDQGGDDEFLEDLMPAALEASARAAGQPLDLRMREGHGHSYFFVQSFIDDHLRHAAEAMA